MDDADSMSGVVLSPRLLRLVAFPDRFALFPLKFLQMISACTLPFEGTSFKQLLCAQGFWFPDTMGV